MKISIKDLKKIIREELTRINRGSHPEESYSEELFSDPTFDQKSVYVPEDIKKKIKKWGKDMGMWSGK